MAFVMTPTEIKVLREKKPLPSRQFKAGYLVGSILVWVLSPIIVPIILIKGFYDSQRSSSDSQ